MVIHGILLWLSMVIFMFIHGILYGYPYPWYLLWLSMVSFMVIHINSMVYFMVIHGIPLWLSMVSFYGYPRYNFMVIYGNAILLW